MSEVKPQPPCSIPIPTPTFRSYCKQHIVMILLVTIAATIAGRVCGDLWEYQDHWQRVSSQDLNGLMHDEPDPQQANVETPAVGADSLFAGIYVMVGAAVGFAIAATFFGMIEVCVVFLQLRHSLAEIRAKLQHPLPSRA